MRFPAGMNKLAPKAVAIAMLVVGCGGCATPFVGAQAPFESDAPTDSCYIDLCGLQAWMTSMPCTLRIVARHS